MSDNRRRTADHGNMRSDRGQSLSPRGVVVLTGVAAAILILTAVWLVAIHRSEPSHSPGPAAIGSGRVLSPATTPSVASPEPPSIAAGTQAVPSGSIVVRQSGQTIQGLYVQGTITIADGVTDTTIRNVVVTDDTPGFLIDNEGANLTVENSRLVGAGYPAPRDAIRPGGGHFVLIGCDISGVRNGVDLRGDSVVENTHIHDLVHNPGSHNEDLYIGSGSHIQILHNTLINELPQTAAIFIATDFGSVSDVLIQGNVLAGGGYAIYGGAGGRHGSAIGVRVLNNIFSRQVAAKGGKFGLRAYWPKDPQSQWLGNTWPDHTPAGV